MPEREPLDHVLRPTLPWRSDTLTECGLDDNRPAISQEALYERIKALGKQRAAMVTCMTCWNRCVMHGTFYLVTWENDPVAVMSRETERVRWGRGESKDRLAGELKAMTALIEAHRDEFDGFLTGLGETSDLTQRRAAKRAKAVRR